MGGNISKFTGFYNMDKICIFPYPFAAITALNPYERPQTAAPTQLLQSATPLRPEAQWTCLLGKPRALGVASVCVFCGEVLLLFPFFHVRPPP